MGTREQDGWDEIDDTIYERGNLVGEYYCGMCALEREGRYPLVEVDRSEVERFARCSGCHCDLGGTDEPLEHGNIEIEITSSISRRS